MRGAVIFCVGALAAVGGCSLASSGLMDDVGTVDASAPGVLDSGAPSLQDANGPADDADATATTKDSAAPPHDAADAGAVVAPIDASTGDACGTPTRASGTVVTATPETTPPIIDGDLSDWPCADWTVLDESDAQYVVDAGPPISAFFALVYDVSHLYVAWHVFDANVLGGNLVTPYVNDAVELFLSGDASPNGDYDSQSHHFVIDHNNLCVDYGPPQQVPPMAQIQSPMTITSATKVVPGVGFDVEAVIDIASIGQGELESEQSLLFDTQLDTGNGFTQGTAVLWALAPHGSCGCVNLACCCGKSPDTPSCDTERFGTLKLQ